MWSGYVTAYMHEKIVNHNMLWVEKIEEKNISING